MPGGREVACSEADLKFVGENVLEPTHTQWRH